MQKSRDEIKGFVIRTIASILNRPASEEFLSDSLSECGMDSLNTMTLIVYIEKEYSITFEESEFIEGKFQNMDEIVELISKYLGS